MNQNNENFIKLDFYLNDILSYTDSALHYLKSNNKKELDVDEIIMYLSTVPEIIEEIEMIIDELEEKLNGQL